MDSKEFSDVFLRGEIAPREIPANKADFSLAARAKVFASNAPSIFALLTATSFNPLTAIGLLIKMAQEIEEEITADKKLDTLLFRPYKAGLEHLENAGRILSDDTRKRELGVASDCFLEVSKDEHSLVAAKAMFLAGVCYELLGEKDLALDKYRKAYKGGQQEIINRESRLRNTKVSTSVITDSYVVLVATAPLLGPLGAIGLIAYRAFRWRKAKKLPPGISSVLTDRVIDTLRAKEIQEIDEFQKSFLTLLSEVLSRHEFPLIEKSGDYP